MAARTAGYLEAKAPYLDYPAALAADWPIATGMIETARAYCEQKQQRFEFARRHPSVPPAEGAEAARSL